MKNLLLPLAAALLGGAALCQSVPPCAGASFAPSFHPAGYLPTDLALADLDGDGVPDLAIANGQAAFAVKQANHVGVARNGGSASYTSTLGFAVGVNPVALAAGDVDGDHDVDLVTADNGWYDFGAQGWRDCGLSVLANRGDGGFALASSVIFDAAHSSPSAVALGDVDGDADLDLLVAVQATAYTAAELGVLRNDGAGGFAAPVWWPAGQWVIALDLGDLDADGDLDVALLEGYLSSMHPLRVMLGAGDGSFALAAGAWGVGGYPKDMRLADVDGDTDLDALVVREYGVTLLRNQGDASFTSSVAASAFGPSSIAAGDIDGDGDLDIETLDTLIDTVSVKLNDGSGSCTGGASVYAGIDPIAPGIADMDQDGDADVLAANAGSKDVTTLAQQCATPALTAAPVELGLAKGGTQFLELRAGAAHAGALYALVGTASGTQPGTQLGALHVPINVDAYTLAMLSLANTGPFVGTLGLLGGAGEASAQIALPAGAASALLGLELRHAFVALGAGGEFASPAVLLVLGP